jgi:hypothetical protein
MVVLILHNFHGLAVVIEPSPGSMVATLVLGLVLIALAVAYMSNVGGFRDSHARQIIGSTDPVNRTLHRIFGPPPLKRVTATQIGVGVGGIIFGLILIGSALTGLV